MGCSNDTETRDDKEKKDNIEAKKDNNDNQSNKEEEDSNKWDQEIEMPKTCAPTMIIKNNK